MISPAITRESTQGRTTSFTVEAAAYGVLVALSLGLRLAALGGTPLSSAEAAQALAAHHLVQGDDAVVAAGGTIAPALLTLQSLAFFLAGAADWSARLPVLLITSLSPLAFWFWRPTVGRRPALLAAGLLCLSPFWTASGSVGSGPGLAGAALLFAVGAESRRRTDGGRRWAAAAGVALGIALAAAPEGWAAVALGLLFWLALGLEPPDRPDRLALAAGLGATVLLLSTVGFLHPAGLQSFLDTGASLVTSFVHRQPSALLHQLLLAFYEPLLLILGLAVMALRRPRGTGERALHLWTAAALLLALLGGRPGFGVVLALPALALLAAQAVDVLAQRLAQLPGRQTLEVLAVGGILVGYGAIALTGLARREDLVFLLLFLTALGIGGALLALLWLRDGRTVALTAVGAVAVALLLLWSAAGTFQGVTSRRALPQELTQGEVTMPGALDLVHDVVDLSWSRTGFGRHLDLVAQREAGPVVAWYLRDLDRVTWVDRVTGDPGAPALLAFGTGLELSAGEYVGQDYAITGRWRPSFDGVGAFLRWLLYREVPVKTIETDWVSLWVRTESAP